MTFFFKKVVSNDIQWVRVGMELYSITTTTYSDGSTKEFKNWVGVADNETDMVALMALAKGSS